MTRVLWLESVRRPEMADALHDLRNALRAAGLPVVQAHETPQDGDVLVVWADSPVPDGLAGRLGRPGLPALLLGPTLCDADPDGALAEAAGLRISGATPVHDVRVHAGPDAGTLAPRGHRHAEGDHIDTHAHLTDRVLVVDKVRDDVAVLLQAWVGLDPQPVATWRPATGTATWLLGTTPESCLDRQTVRTLLGLLRVMTGAPEPTAVRVGLLGYGAIGHEHSRAVRAVDGLELAAVCDRAEHRLSEASLAAPGILTTTDADELVDAVDLVVVSTPPSSHADWALRALRAGKHVIVEKPFAIETAHADAVMAQAAESDRLVAVYQNRRFDPDHLAVRRAVASGALGDVFHVETFVGGYGHPCNLWHSDAGVSGGAFYDWGSHVLDQILDLVPTEVEHVTAATHKRRWFDVTNADHSRVTLRFTDGTEAEFIHSDLAAALKPRWYVLGTTGAIVGSWRTERIVSRNDIGTLAEDVLAPADSPPLLDLHAADGSVTRLATPLPDPYPFHHELADRLLLGQPMTVTAAQSRRVLSVMEAARGAADDGGRPVVPR
jgi:scyllo-inositol 2-dehydrogenase (NADP+)